MARILSNSASGEFQIQTTIIAQQYLQGYDSIWSFFEPQDSSISCIQTRVDHTKELRDTIWHGLQFMLRFID